MKKRVRAREAGKPPKPTRIAIVSQSSDAMTGVDLAIYKTQILIGRRIISVQDPRAPVLETTSHPFIPNASPELRKRMLDEIGIHHIDELYSDIPAKVRLNRPLKIDGFYSEMEVRERIEKLLQPNKSAADYDSFLGAGIYNHYIPAAVKVIMSRTEFQTSYTPYQAEISQGLLQALFEFESMIRDLTAVDAVNSSLYDGSTAIGEAIRMAVRATGRYKVLVPRALHPDKMSVLRNYTEPVGIRVETVGYDSETGCLDIGDLQSKIDRDTAAVFFEVPSFFGILDPEAVNIPALCHEKGTLSLVGCDLVSLAGLRPPGEYGADIVVAEGQSISSEMNFGGPGLGIIGCKGDSLLRQMPGRLIGMTSTLDGMSRAFSMVLQTREQHIRRERATSNICTNEALLGIGAAAYLSLLGPKGLSELFQTILTKTKYAIKALRDVPNASVPRFSGNHYQEFVISFPKGSDSVSKVNRELLAARIHGGRSLVNDFPELGQSSLVCITEVSSMEAIDRLRGTMTKTLGAL